MRLFLSEASVHLSRQFLEKLTDSAIIKIALWEDLSGEVARGGLRLHPAVVERVRCKPFTPSSQGSIESLPFRARALSNPQQRLDSCGPYRDGEVMMLKSSPNFTPCAGLRRRIPGLYIRKVIAGRPNIWRRQ
jgi:hypothetical protein